MSDYLCQELIEEILARLPPKSLLRFRSLSKYWCSSISSPDFIRNNAIQCAKKTTKTIFIGRQIHFQQGSRHYHYIDIELSSFHINIDCNIVGSCYGIVCLHKSASRSTSLILWNPSITHKLIVPHHLCLLHCYNVALGFGFDAIVEDYIIVGTCYGSVLSSYIYTMKTNSWNEIAPPTNPIFKARKYPCFVGGVLHWVVKCESHKTSDWYILTFDMRTRVFGKISLPKPCWETIQVTIIKGYLAVIAVVGYDLWMWMRRNYNDVESWSNGFKLTSRGFEGRDCVIELSNYLEDPSSYNPCTGMVSTLVGCSDPSNSYIVDFDVCSESLELLDRESC